jgi:hypothetical protein
MRALVAILLVLPIAAQAGKIFVDYDGTVEFVGGSPPGYALGDRIAGRLIIDADLAGPDLLPDDPISGRYGAIPFPAASGQFVTGYWPPSVGSRDVDNFGIDDNPGQVRDFFVLEDAQDDPVDGLRRLALELSLRHIASGDDINQSFAVESDDPNRGQHMFGFLVWAGNQIQFALNKLSMRPEKCFL